MLQQTTIGTSAGGYTLRDVLAVEDDRSILDFRCPETSLLIWPHLRIAFFRLILGDLLYGGTFASISAGRTRPGKACATLARSALHNIRYWIADRDRADICVVSAGVGNQWSGDVWLNRLSDHFALCGPTSTLTLEDHFDWNWPFPRRNARVIFHAPIQTCNALFGRLMVGPKHRRQAEDLIGLLADRARHHLDWRLGPQRERALVESFARKIASVPQQYRGYEALLRRIRPRLLMILCGCYGPLSALIMAARRMGILTAEYQHGSISAGHDGYNFAPAIRDSSEYRQTLPDYFLSYGKWWHDQINAPVGKVAIGNPHRSAMLAETRRAEARKDVLILSDGIEFDSYLELSRQIQPWVTKKGLRLVLRPHPSERPAVASAYGDRVEGISLDSGADLYASLQSAKVVVSEVSTGLFDAIGLVDKIFVWDTAKSRFCYPQHPFRCFVSAPELIEMLGQGEAGRLSPSEIEAFWLPDWKRNYLAFLETHGITVKAG